MNDAERIDRLEKLLAKMADALVRKDTVQDGNWGYSHFRDEVKEVLRELKPK